MCNYWANFVKTGNPNGADADGAPMPEWLAYTAERRRTMFFGKTPQMDGCGETGLMNFLIGYDHGKL